MLMGGHEGRHRHYGGLVRIRSSLETKTQNLSVKSVVHFVSRKITEISFSLDSNLIPILSLIPKR